MHLTQKTPQIQCDAEANRDGNVHNTTGQRISLANQLFHTWGDILSREPRLGAVIEELSSKIDGTQQAMQVLDIVSTCRKCDEFEGGSCCGAGIESKYDVPLLLLNLLMGVKLPTERPVPGSCWFLGERGCLLRVRHVLCVNYLCSKIERQLSSEGRALLQEATGLELDSSFVANELIVQFMIREGQV